jgi:hypothetical protein
LAIGWMIARASNEAHHLFSLTSRRDAKTSRRYFNGRSAVDRLRHFVDALRVLAQTNDPNRIILVENAIEDYLKGEPGNVRLSLERLCDAIEREEAEKRRAENWSIAGDYVRSRLRRLA